MQEPSPQTEGLSPTGLGGSAIRLVGVWLQQTLRLYTSPRIDVSRFPSNRAFPTVLSLGTLVAFFCLNSQQGASLPANAGITLLMAYMILGAIRKQPRVRYSSAFNSALALGLLVSVLLSLAEVRSVFIDLEAVWVMITIFRISRALVDGK